MPVGGARVEEVIEVTPKNPGSHSEEVFVAVLLKGAQHLFVEKKRAKVGFRTCTPDEFLAIDEGNEPVRGESRVFRGIWRKLDRHGLRRGVVLVRRGKLGRRHGRVS